MSHSFFDIKPYKGETSLLVERLYAAFSAYQQEPTPCSQCFESYDINSQINKKQNIRNIPLNNITHLYYEHPGCLGYRNFKRFFPIMLHRNLWFDDSGIPLIYQACWAGLWGWPEDEQDLIHDILLLSFRNWIEGGSFEPLQYDSSFPPNEIAGHFLLDSLIISRTHPHQLVDYLLNLSSADRMHGRNAYSVLRARSTICSAILEPTETNLLQSYSGQHQNIKEGPRLCALLMRSLIQEQVTEEMIIDWYLETGELLSTMNDPHSSHSTIAPVKISHRIMEHAHKHLGNYRYLEFEFDSHKAYDDIAKHLDACDQEYRNLM